MLPLVLFFSSTWKGLQSLPFLSEFNSSNYFYYQYNYDCYCYCQCYYRYCYYIMKKTIFMFIVWLFLDVCLFCLFSLLWMKRILLGSVFLNHVFAKLSFLYLPYQALHVLAHSHHPVWPRLWEKDDGAGSTWSFNLLCYSHLAWTLNSPMVLTSWLSDAGRGCFCPVRFKLKYHWVLGYFSGAVPKHQTGSEGLAGAITVGSTIHTQQQTWASLPI